jgi:hypothetical protein
LQYSPYFSLSVDHDAGVVFMTLRGKWSSEIMADFHKARSELIKSLGPQMNDYCCLSDIREQEILPADLAEVERISIAKMQFKPRKLAYVVQSALKNIQSRRVADQRLMRSFESESEALEWLKSDET